MVTRDDVPRAPPNQVQLLSFSSSSSVLLFKGMSTSKEPPLLIPHPPTPLQLQAWLQRHLDLLLAERRAEVAESHLLLSSVSPKVLEANGLALGRLGILDQSVGAGGKRIVELHRPAAFNNESNFPPHSFRTGDVVKIVDEAGDKQAGGSKKKSSKKSDDNGNVDGIDGVITRVTDTRIYVAIGRSRRKSGGDEGEDDELPSRCRLVQVANEVTWERMEKNLLRLAQKLEVAVRTSRGIRGGSDSAVVDNGDSSSDDEAKPSTSSVPTSSTAPLPATPPALPSLPPLLRFLLALDPPSRLPASLPAPPLPLFNSGLNETQRSALSRALVSQQVHLIHGPPGTGKTTVLVELILQLVLGKGERVLVAGSSNLAVDNLAARLVTFRKGRDKDLRPIRIGHPARILSSLQNHTLDYLSTSSDSGRLLTDTRNELQAAYASLHTGTYRAQQEGKLAAGNKSTSKRGTSSANNKKLTGSERKKVYEEVKALRGELKQRERGLFTETIASANVVLSTLHGASGGVLERSLRTPKGQEKDKKLFDTVIIDEACQSLEASIWGAILDKMEDNGRLILAGDDKQLGPVVKSESTSRRRQDKGRKKDKPKAKPKKDSSLSDTKELEQATEEVAISEQAPKDDAVEDQYSSEDEAADGEGPEGDTVSLDPTPSDSVIRHTLRPPSSLHKTLFTRLISLYGSSSHLKSLLTVQYRMSSPIMDYPNQALYEDKLVAHESCKDGWLGDGHISSWKGSPSDHEEIKGGSVVFYDTAGSEMYESTDAEESSASTTSSVHSHSICNVHEVQIIQSHLDLLFQSGIPPEAITILAPYSAQISLISSTLSSSLTPEVFTPLEVGTIDSLQGREQQIVILSLVRSNESGEIGFLKEVRRLNVAMTRAKRQLVVIGDSETVRKGGKYLKEWMDWLEEFAIVEPVLP